MPSPETMRRLTRAIRSVPLPSGQFFIPSPPIKASRTDCISRGNQVGSVTCSDCKGKVELKVFECSIHGKCTLGKGTASLSCCENCKQYQPSSPPVHPLILESRKVATSIKPYPKNLYNGNGIVICGGGSYLPSVYVSVRLLRHLGCILPIQVWYIGQKERDTRYEKLLTPWGVEFINILSHHKSVTARNLQGHPGSPPFNIKTFAVLHSPWENVLCLDADSYACSNPTSLFTDPEFLTSGAVFWPDLPGTNSWTKWEDWGVERFGPECGWEVGQYLVSKKLAWEQLNLARWYDDHGDWCYGGQVHHDHGDKGPHRIAWAVYRKIPTFFSTRCIWERVAFVQVGPDGRTPMFIHRCRSKFALNHTPVYFSSTFQNGTNIRANLPLEVEAFAYLEELGGLLK